MTDRFIPISSSVRTGTFYHVPLSWYFLPCTTIMMDHISPNWKLYVA